MKTFREYLTEAVENEHKAGTYASLSVDKTCREQLHSWLTENEVGGDLLDATDYHCTIVYSRKGVPEIANIEAPLPIKAEPKEWKIFGDDKILVLAVTNPKLNDLFNKTRDMGAESDYPSFVPHVSVATNYKGEVPATIPDFPINFTKFKVNELDADFSYNED